MSDEILEDTIIEEASTLPPSLINNLAVSGDFYKMAFQFQQIMMIYESAIKQIETKLDILNKESSVNRTRNPISTVKSRLKSPESIAKKLEKKGYVMAAPDEKDKRKQRIFVTEKCRTFLEQNDNNGQQSQYVIGRIFDGIDEKSLQTTIQTIMKMERNLSEL